MPHNTIKVEMDASNTHLFFLKFTHPFLKLAGDRFAQYLHNFRGE